MVKREKNILEEVEDTYLFMHIRPGGHKLSEIITPEPQKITGTLLMLVRRGHGGVVEINLEEQETRPGTIVMAFPGNVIRTKGRWPADLDAFVLYFDTKFSRNVNIRLTTVAIPSKVDKPRTYMHLEPAETELIERYFRLIAESAPGDSNPQIRRSIATSLTAALFYQMVDFYHKRLPGEVAGEPARNAGGSRRREYVREFLRLVHLHYTRERAVAFYADKLFISPKYLSLMVKEATGRSAASWIDEFVLMEAKNMLRFSGKNIQQVAYSLNFPTQSSFGKYFKHLTGMSPTEFQKS